MSNFVESSGIKEIPEDYVTDSDSNYVTEPEEEEEEEENFSDFDDEYDDDDDDEDVLEETIAERISALKDVIPAPQRQKICSFAQRIYNLGAGGVYLTSKIAWVLTTSALLVVFPLALENDREQMVAQWEEEQKMLGQQPGQAPFDPNNPHAAAAAAAGGVPMPPTAGIPGVPGVPGLAPSTA
ncbi:mitochondrial import receptor subunit Tom22 [Mycoemilia scoparia]|uniref:Mitochondrial import receptor subunit Tom22 n=1 Tax=Mycoemilia scoparia TaxID=417184 RepID=A0A9W7ZUK5_9FUNG|nr:mitochondrial import receptor subunit Tom22 [Mycoemilia scoparia]